MDDLLPLIGAVALGIVTGFFFMLWREYRKSVAIETITGLTASDFSWNRPCEECSGTNGGHYNTCSHFGNSRLKTAMANADDRISADEMHIAICGLPTNAPKPVRKPTKKPTKKPAAKPRAKSKGRAR